MALRTFARLLAGVALVALPVTACSRPTTDPGGVTSDPTTTVAGEGALGTVTTTTTEPAPTGTSSPPERMPASWQVCDNPPAGYSIGYPGGWHTATLDGQFACSFFHPEPFIIPANSEFPRVALMADQTDISVAEYQEFVTDSEYFDVVRNEDVTILGRPGIRFESVNIGLLLEEEGARWYGYIIDSGAGKAFVVWTVAGPTEARYDEWKSIVDIARDSVRFLH